VVSFSELVSFPFWTLVTLTFCPLLNNFDRPPDTVQPRPFIERLSY
jgi:hypothetical protein